MQAMTGRFYGRILAGAMTKNGCSTVRKASSRSDQASDAVGTVVNGLWFSLKPPTGVTRWTAQLCQ